LKLQTAAEHRSERSLTLYQLASCFLNKPQPDWDKAAECYSKALELQTDQEQLVNRARTLYSLAYSCHNKPEPDWAEAINYYRGALEFMIAPENRAERAWILYQLAYCLHEQPEPDWDSAGRFAQEGLELSRLLGERGQMPLPPSQLASILEEMSNPDLDTAIEFRRESVENLKNIRSIFELIIALDRKGEYNEGDYWEKKLENTNLLDIDESEREALKEQRMAFLELRRNSLDQVLTLADKLRNGPQHSRALSLAAIAHFARDENEVAYRDLVNAKANRKDLTWLRKVAEGYFKRYGKDELGGFLRMMDEATQVSH